jgi:glucose-1-phosphate adenylyltransferase
MSSVYTMILAGGVGSRLSILTEQRAKPAVPFGGKFRIIDFALSNCANSGLFDVGLLTQYRPLSLIDHVGTGRVWDMDRVLGGLHVLQPYLEAESGDWYQGTADAVYRNLMQVTQRSVEDVLILSGDHVYAMDYGPMIKFHRERRFPATVAVTRVPTEMISQFGIVQTSSADTIVGFQEKPRPEEAKGNLASMGIYIFRRDTLVRLLEEGAGRDRPLLDFGKDIFPQLIEAEEVGAHTFDGYWQDIGTVQAFYEANMKLLDPKHGLNPSEKGWPIRTPSAEAPPARLGRGASVQRSLVANGAVVYGRVENSILFPGAVVDAGAVVRDSILMNGVHVHAEGSVTRAILDKRVQVARGVAVGGAGETRPNDVIPELLCTGITILGKDVVLEEGTRVGRNVCLGGRRILPAGTEVGDGGYLEGSFVQPNSVTV